MDELPFHNLEDLLREAQGSTAVSMDRNRPYDGQPHTDNGMRGQHEVHGISMRDVTDCLIRAIVLSSDPGTDAGMDLRRKLGNGSLIHDNIYDADLSLMDPLAIAKNLTCEIEKMMGIYPNVPGLSTR